MSDFYQFLKAMKTSYGVVLLSTFGW